MTRTPCADCGEPACYRVTSDIINVPVCAVCVERAREVERRSWIHREGRIRIEKIIMLDKLTST